MYKYECLKGIKKSRDTIEILVKKKYIYLWGGNIKSFAVDFKLRQHQLIHAYVICLFYVIRIYFLSTNYGLNIFYIIIIITLSFLHTVSRVILKCRADLSVIGRAYLEIKSNGENSYL